MSNVEYDCVYKIVIIGDTAVGKSNIIYRYIKDDFMPESKATVGADFATKIIDIDKKSIRLQIWDTSGSEQYRSMTTSYYKGAVGALLVYDIAKRSTFQNIPNWLSDIKNNIDQNGVVLLVGNKYDLAEFREVQTEEAIDFAEKNNMMYIETSALEGINITEVFRAITEEIYKIHKTNPSQTFKSSTVSSVYKDSIVLSNSYVSKKTPKKKNNCC